MKIKNKLRTAAELTISATMIATLLAACGGGGGGGTAATVPGSNTVNVTPGKGIMTGATVEIRDANHNLLGSQLTTASGVAAVSIPATSTGPFIISVSCLSAACSYYDEKTKLNVSGTAAMPALQAVVPGVMANIGVTAATNAAAQYALNTGAALTPTSITAANTVVASKLGLTGIDILTPPTIIANDADYQAAKGGTTAANLLADISAAFAMSASGVSAMQAIADYGNAWKVAAITPASGLIMPSTINTAALTLATSGVGGMTGVPVTTIPNIASAVAASTTTITANMTAVNDFITTGMSSTGLRGYNPQSVNSNASAVASVTTLAAGATTGSYTYTGVMDKLTGGVWSAAAVGQGRSYILGATGWVLDNGSGTAVNNNNGTVRITNATEGTITVAVIETALNGTLIPLSTASAVPAGVSATFPAGSIAFAGTGGVTSKDTFGLGFGSQVTDMSGVALTALPTIGTGFCANGFTFSPITVLTQAAATAQGASVTDNYEVLGNNGGGCTAAAITSGLVNQIGNSTQLTTTTGNMGMGFATVTTKATGIAAVPSVGYVQSVSTNTTNFFATTNAGYLATGVNQCIMGVAGGWAHTGCPLNGKGQGFTPTSTAIPTAINSLNKTAFDALLLANGFPVLP